MPEKKPPDMPDQDQIVDAIMARAIQADAARTHLLLALIVMQEEPPMPPGLVQSDRQPADPPEVVELWFPPAE